MTRWGRRKAYEVRIAWRLWWLRQQVELLEWRIKLDAMMPQPVEHDVATLAGQGGHHGVHAISWLHG